MFVRSSYWRARGVGRPLGVGAILGVGVTGGVGDAVALGVGDGVASDDAQYLPPVFTKPRLCCPPQTIISLPLHSAVCSTRALGASVMLVAVQLSAPGLYLAPVFKKMPLVPPQTIISLPLHTAV